MVYSKNRMTPYHQQDTDYYCGAATAQMILDSIGAGIIDQTTLYNSNQSHNTQSGWATDPDGLNYTLNHYKPQPPTFSSYFLVEPKDSEHEGSVNIVRTLETYNVATGTLVFGNGHWVVVRGFSTDVPPASSTYSILGFYINNPWPPVPSWSNPTLTPPPPPHNDSNDGCGTGGNRGINNEYVSYTQWQNTYFTGGDVWNIGRKQYVSVCDPRKAKVGEFIMKPEKLWAKGDRLITSEEASKFALQGIKLHNLLKDEYFAKSLSGARPRKPVLIQRLDLLDTYYYLIPMIINRGMPAILSVGGLYGEFQGGQAFIKPFKEVPREPDEVSKGLLQNVMSKPIELGERLGKLIVREGAYCLYPIMVWKPCQESRSPYYPFYMITVGSKQIYIDYEGKIYPTLHAIGPGG